MNKKLNHLSIPSSLRNPTIMKMEQRPHEQQQPPFFLCEETRELDYETGLADDQDLQPELGYESPHGGVVYGPIPPPMLMQDLHWDPDELPSLLSKQDLNNHFYRREVDGTPPRLLAAREDAADWIMKAHAFYPFSVPTAVLAIDYLDRFLLSCLGTLEDEKPWMTQLSAVACLSLAAKVEETLVPLLLDFQVAESCYVFEAKTIQRMEVVVLSSLQWRMNPVTPLSFLDFAMRRFGFKDVGLCRAFRSRFEKLLLSVLPDHRFVGYLPSVLASAIMLQVAAALKLELDIIGVLGADEEMVGKCYEFVSDSAWRSNKRRSNKRKFGSFPGSPRGVIDLWCSSSSSDSSDNSWGSSGTSSATSSPEPNKRRVQRGEGREDHHLIEQIF